MPLYFFDVTEDGVSFPDRFGAVLDGVGDVRPQAQQQLLDTVPAEVGDAVTRTTTCEVRNGRGRVFYRAKLELKVEPVEGR